jgi:hypothetical protein
VSVGRYRKKPIVIEAMQLTGEDWTWRTILNWVPEAFERQDGIIIPTLEGDHLAQPGDWIIRGVAGEFYPCKPDIFEATYEAAS